MTFRPDRFLTGSTGRILLSGLFLLAGAGVVCYRLVGLQVLEAAELSQRAVRQHEKAVSVEGRRGSILDRNGKILASSVEVPSIYAVPGSLASPARAAEALARILGTESAALLRRFEGNRNFTWVARKVSPAVAERVRALELDGVGILPESQRFYPKRYLLGHMLGFTGVDNQGLEGIELRYDDILHGEKEWVVLERDALGRSIFPKGQEYLAPPRGKDVVLTIDELVQHVVERELDSVMEGTRADSATAVVLNPKSGEILALAVRPDFNPNRVESRNPSQWRNRAITDTFEPGSTLKIVTAAAALEEGVVSPSDIFYCEEGRMVLAGGVIRDHEKEGYLTFSQVIQKSSNIGTVKIAQRLGDRALYRYMRAFGFGEKTGIDLMGESPGMVKDPKGWSGRSLASISIGQEIAATPIQVAAAAAAVANGGWLVRPYLVSEIRDGSGRTIRSILPEIRRQVISRETARQMLSILEGTVSKKGTGVLAAVEGYSIAGKTGTAQKFDTARHRYSPTETVSSFVGIAPSDDPRVVVLIVVDNPKGPSWGGSVAAPVFKKIVEQILPHLGIPPRDFEGLAVAMAD